MGKEVDAGVNELVKEILTRCNCFEYAKYFKGLDKSAFRNLSLSELRERLAEEGEASAIALKISDELLRFSGVAEVREAPEVASKTKKVASNGQVSSTSREQNDPSKSSLAGPSSGQLDVVQNLKEESSSESESDSDYEPLLAPESTAPKVIEEVSLESDSEVVESSTPAHLADPAGTGDGEISGSSAGTSSQRNSGSSRYSLRTRETPSSSLSSDSLSLSESESDDAVSEYSDSDQPAQKRSKPGKGSCPRRKRKNPFVVSNPATVIPSLGRNRSVVAQCSYVKIAPEHTRDYHNCNLDDPPQSELQSWVEFYERFGPYIYFLDLEVWSWRPARSKCPFNLLKIFRSCGSLRELCLNVQLLPEALEDSSLPRKSLRNLTKLSVNHSGNIIYQGPLNSILKAASGLQCFECSFHSLEEANEILQMLQDVSSLKSLTFRSHAKDGYITRDQITKLTQISAENLEELELGNGLWEDIDGACVESLLRRFPKLKTFKVNGSYQGNSLLKPDIVISVPPMPDLEFLDIGGNYEFASVDQSPGGKDDTLSRSSNVITVEDDLKTELFSVTIKFPLLPSLKTLILGNLFKIDELHFSSFPILRVIRVGSPWHLTVKFSENRESRKFSYPLVTDLQLPDCLKDPSFVQNIPARFPNLKKCWIFLPSVKVLRTFFKSMENSRLEELYLKTQYDFEATMELCLLGRPSKAPKNYRDYMRFEDLEKYGKFQEFVQFYNIELPPKKIEDVRELEEETCAGLKSLKHLKILQLEHIPRILRIPKGNLHWTHTNAEFTDYFIGFKQYPLSGNCLRQLPVKHLRSCTWPNFIVSGNDAQVLYQKGFQGCGDEDMEVVYDGAGTSKTQRRTAVARRGEKLKVEIQPAMLQASLEFREKKERK